MHGRSGDYRHGAHGHHAPEHARGTDPLGAVGRSHTRVLAKDGEPVADSKTILILGGGVGGVATARALRKRVPKAHRVVLVDRERDHVFAPSLLWLMVGQRRADAITRPLARLARKGIDVRVGTVEHIDPDRRIVTVAGEAITTDYLVIARRRTRARCSSMAGSASKRFAIASRSRSMPPNRRPWARQAPPSRAP